MALLLTDSDVFAGTEQHILSLACALKGEGVEVRIGCPSPAPLAERAAERDVEVLTVQKRGLVDIPAVILLRRELKGGKLDLIHAHNGRTALSSALAVALARRGRLVVTQHFLEPAHTARRGAKATLSRLAHCTVNSRVSRFIAVSAEAGRRMAEREGVPEERISVIPNGISPDLSALRPAAEVRSALGIPEDAPLAVCVSRLEKEKDVGTLVRAMAGVRRTLPRARCVVVGDGSQRRALEALRDEEGLGDAVLFAGHQPDALSIIGASDLLVLPSLAEPFGLVLLEAMALCKAVVATDAGGPREIVVNGETGVLAPPGDADAMAEAIAGLLSDPETARAMGREGRRRYLELYTAERMARDTLAVYRQVLEEG